MYVQVLVNNFGQILKQKVFMWRKGDACCFAETIYELCISFACINFKIKMTLLLLFFLLSIVFSFLCSIWEAVLLSVNPSFIKRKEQEGDLTGKLMADLKADIDKPLSAILSLNTIAHTVGAIGVGAQVG